jgi:hypothetical protein
MLVLKAEIHPDLKEIGYRGGYYCFEEWGDDYRLKYSGIFDFIGWMILAAWIFLLAVNLVTNSPILGVLCYAGIGVQVCELYWSSLRNEPYKVLRRLKKLARSY